jgi:hypothetical protein
VFHYKKEFETAIDAWYQYKQDMSPMYEALGKMKLSINVNFGRLYTATIAALIDRYYKGDPIILKNINK